VQPLLRAVRAAAVTALRQPLRRHREAVTVRPRHLHLQEVCLQEARRREVRHLEAAEAVAAAAEAEDKKCSQISFAI